MGKVQIEIAVSEWVRPVSIFPTSPQQTPTFLATVTGTDLLSAVNQMKSHLDELVQAREIEAADAAREKKAADKLQDEKRRAEELDVLKRSSRTMAAEEENPFVEDEPPLEQLQSAVRQVREATRQGKDFG